LEVIMFSDDDLEEIDEMGHDEFDKLSISLEDICHSMNISVEYYIMEFHC